MGYMKDFALTFMGALIGLAILERIGVIDFSRRR